MEWIVWLFQVVIALGIFNVWIIRFGKPTEYRGGEAQNMNDEFVAYGLPAWSLYVVGGAKLLLAVLLLVGIWFPPVTQPAALVMAGLMVGAIAMHFKVKDPIKRAFPAFAMLVMSCIVAFFSSPGIL